MERKIGEKFAFYFNKLQVIETNENTCEGCFFRGRCSQEIREKTGLCDERTDKKNVIFVETDEAPEQVAENEQAEQSKNERQDNKLNLLEVLKYCPVGTQFWSPLAGAVKFKCLDDGKVVITLSDETTWYINPDSTMTLGGISKMGITSVEPMLYPSETQRDWSKVHYPKPIELLPKTWKDFCFKNPVIAECWITQNSYIMDERTGANRLCDDDRNLLPTRSAAEAHLALMQLHQLRDCWRDGWKPREGEHVWQIRQNWASGDFKPVVYLSSYPSFITFQDEERARKFAEYFDLLIEKAGDLI